VRCLKTKQWQARPARARHWAAAEAIPPPPPAFPFFRTPTENPPLWGQTRQGGAGAESDPSPPPPLSLSLSAPFARGGFAGARSCSSLLSSALLVLLR
jgi:hypothetical protein